DTRPVGAAGLTVVGVFAAGHGRAAARGEQTGTEAQAAEGQDVAAAGSAHAAGQDESGGGGSHRQGSSKVGSDGRFSRSAQAAPSSRPGTGVRVGTAGAPVGAGTLTRSPPRRSARRRAGAAGSGRRRASAPSRRRWPP